MRTLHAPLAALLLASLLAGCLGTEIGNGNKHENEGGKAAKADGHVQKDAVNEEGAPTAQAENDDEGATGADGADGATFEPLPSFTFDLDLLLAPCGSPLGDDLQSPLKLAEAGSSATDQNIVNATFDAGAQAWDVTDHEGILVRRVLPVAGSSQAEVTTRDAQGSPVTGYSCAAPPATTPSVTVDGLTGSYERTQVTVLRGNRASIVTWYLEGAAPFKLVRVTIDDVDGEDDPMVLDAQ